MRESINCRSCNAETRDVLSLGNQQIAGFTEPGGKRESFPLDLVKCPECNLVQLKETVPSELLYNDDYGYRSGINETIKADLKEIVSSALELKPDAKKVLDCGANDGELLKNYPDEISKVAVEPVEKFHDTLLEIPHTGLMGTFWPVEQKNCDIVTFVGCWYDFPDPNEATAALKKSLSPDGIAIIQQNYLPSMLKQNAFDNICHEHIEYYSLTSLEPLLNRHGLETFRVEENDINGGSFRTYVSHAGSRSPEPSVADMLKREKEEDLDQDYPYETFAKKAERWREIIDTIFPPEKDKTTYAYGASTRGAVLVQLGNLERFVDAVVERNPDKIGKEYLGIPIISEKEAEKKPPDFKLILPWFHPSIQEREKAKDPDIPIIIPLPSVYTV